jgi:hypothetical protein
MGSQTFGPLYGPDSLPGNHAPLRFPMPAQKPLIADYQVIGLVAAILAAQMRAAGLARSPGIDPIETAIMEAQRIMDRARDLTKGS